MKVVTIIASILELPESEIAMDSAPGVTKNWTSFKQLAIISTIESEFGLKFSLREIKKMRSVEGIVNVLKERGVENV